MMQPSVGDWRRILYCLLLTAWITAACSPGVPGRTQEAAGTRLQTPGAAPPDPGPLDPAGLDSPRYIIHWPEAGRKLTLTPAQLEALGVETIGSAYFDRAMGYSGAAFRAVSLATLLQRFDSGRADAVLLDCFDDYQGLVPLRDVRRYQLMLATRITLPPGAVAPSWLRPLLIVVPDGADAPLQERFLTAAIREVRFVRSAVYYAPLDRVGRRFPEAASGLDLYKVNCLHCHALMGVGGNKGGSLPGRYDFSTGADRKRFQSDFRGFHNADHPDKQNVDQFVPHEALPRIALFLQRAAGLL